MLNNRYTPDPVDEWCNFGVNSHHSRTLRENIMPRQSISFTPPNDEWLKAQVESQEYTSKSDVVNDLIRKAREIETIRAKLILSEQSGITDKREKEILADAREEARRNGEM